jgi:hypothetical protein
VAIAGPITGRLAQAALNDYLQLLNVTEVQRELEQTQKLLASWRDSVPDPFEGNEGEPE